MNLTPQIIRYFVLIEKKKKMAKKKQIDTKNVIGKMHK
jgi:hypothetical protein